MTRPRIFLGNGSRQYHGPGRALCAMAVPRRWEAALPRVPDAAPSAAALRAVQAGRLTVAEYRRRFEARMAAHAADMAPGALRYVQHGDTHPVEDGDTLICACAALGSRVRRHPCHLEILAPMLRDAGWDVTIWGAPLGDRSAKDFDWPEVAP